MIFAARAFATNVGALRSGAFVPVKMKNCSIARSEYTPPPLIAFPVTSHDAPSSVTETQCLAVRTSRGVIKVPEQNAVRGTVRS